MCLHEKQGCWMLHRRRRPQTGDGATTVYTGQLHEEARGADALLCAHVAVLQISQSNNVTQLKLSFGIGQHAHETCRLAAQASATALSDSIDRNTPAEVPGRCQEAPSIVSVERTLSLAHRLSYTSFAPPGESLIGTHTKDTQTRRLCAFDTALLGAHI